MQDERTFGEKASDAIAKFGGSWAFLILFSSFLLGWILINSLAAFKIIEFDPFPYILLNLCLSFIAAFQAPIIMMSQNRANRKQDELYQNFFYEIKDIVKQDLEIDTMQDDLRKEQLEDNKVIMEKLDELIKHNKKEK